MYNTTTIAFNPSELSTAMGWTFDDVYGVGVTPYVAPTFSAATWGQE
jgi:hypothetical protein